VIAPARRAATEVTSAVDAGRLDLASALAEAHSALADPRDRALLTDLATGVQRWRLALDFAIHALTRRQPADLDPEVRATLRLGLYQLQHADRLPPSAVVHDAVEIVKRGRTRSAAGLVNAVLRRVVREGPPRLPEPPRVAVDHPQWRSQALAYLAVAHSHPHWLVERWLERFGFEATEAWVRYDNTPADVTIWPLRLAGAAEGPAIGDLAGAPTRFVQGGRVLERGSDAMSLLRRGEAFAQDEASAAVAAVGIAIGRGRVLDACASPGGKTLAMLSLRQEGAVLVANDLRARRVALLADTLRRTQAAVPVLRADARHLPFTGTIDTLLVDAPCSGLGTLRREPDLRWRRTPGDQPALVALQRALVDEGLRVLAPGGRLIYATCSSEPEENEQLVAGVLADRPEWRLVDLAATRLPDSMRPLLNADGTLRTWPHAHGLDAFYAAVVQRSA
jgi:16S rRNA (cytosine967-C5)-methyltransferase